MNPMCNGCIDLMHNLHHVQAENDELMRKLEILKDCMNDLMKDWHPNLSDGAYYHIKEALAKIKETEAK